MTWRLLFVSYSRRNLFVILTKFRIKIYLITIKRRNLSIFLVWKKRTISYFFNRRLLYYDNLLYFTLVLSMMCNNSTRQHGRRHFLTMTGRVLQSAFHNSIYPILFNRFARFYTNLSLFFCICAVKYVSSCIFCSI